MHQPKPHQLKLFSTDGLKHYYYALMAHFEKWEKGEGKKPLWVLVKKFLYGQVIKHQRRRRTVEVERRMLAGKDAKSGACRTVKPVQVAQ